MAECTHSCGSIYVACDVDAHVVGMVGVNVEVEDDVVDSDVDYGVTVSVSLTLLCCRCILASCVCLGLSSSTSSGKVNIKGIYASSAHFFPTKYPLHITDKQFSVIRCSENSLRL